MSRKLKVVKPGAVRDNPFVAIGGGMLIAAGSLRRYNMMTASWGAWGVLWHRPVCFCFIRPHRYTFTFMEEADHFSLSFFDKRYKKVLDFCGSRSGRDVDKMKKAGLTPVSGGKGVVYFSEARLVIVARKIDLRIEDNYPKKDYHRMYVGEVVRCLTR